MNFLFTIDASSNSTRDAGLSSSKSFDRSSNLPVPAANSSSAARCRLRALLQARQSLSSKHGTADGGAAKSCFESGKSDERGGGACAGSVKTMPLGDHKSSKELSGKLASSTTCPGSSSSGAEILLASCENTLSPRGETLFWPKMIRCCSCCSSQTQADGLAAKTDSSSPCLSSSPSSPMVTSAGDGDDCAPLAPAPVFLQASDTDLNSVSMPSQDHQSTASTVFLTPLSVDMLSSSSVPSVPAHPQQALTPLSSQQQRLSQCKTNRKKRHRSSNDEKPYSSHDKPPTCDSGGSVNKQQFVAKPKLDDKTTCPTTNTQNPVAATAVPPLALPSSSYKRRKPLKDDETGRDTFFFVPWIAEQAIEQESEDGAAITLLFFVKRCVSCGATDTPQWRCSWNKTLFLCNPCGIKYSKDKFCSFCKAIYLNNPPHKHHGEASPGWYRCRECSRLGHVQCAFQNSCLPGLCKSCSSSFTLHPAAMCSPRSLVLGRRVSPRASVAATTSSSV